MEEDEWGPDWEVTNVFTDADPTYTYTGPWRAEPAFFSPATPASQLPRGTVELSPAWFAVGHQARHMWFALLCSPPADKRNRVQTKS